MIHRYSEGVNELLWKLREKKGIFIIYMGSARGIYTNIATSTSVFSSSDKKLPRAAICALGNFLPRRKKPRSRGYIGVYSPRRPHIYITYIERERERKRDREE